MKMWLIRMSIIIVVVGIPVYWMMSSIYELQQAPKAKEGILDLRDWDYGENGTIRLVGQWEFYRNQLLTPASFQAERPSDAEMPHLTGMVSVPGKWNAYINEDGKPGDIGYGTYRLKLHLKDAHMLYGIRTNNIRSSNRIFIGGVEIGSSGTPGTSKGEYRADNVPIIGFAKMDQEVVDLIVQVANYSYSSGGIITPIEFGDQHAVQRSRGRGIAGDLMTICGFLMPGIFFLALYRLRKQEKSLLYLGIFCMAALLYVLTHGEKLLPAILPHNYEIVLRLQLISSAFFYYYMIQYVNVTAPKTIDPHWLTLSRVLFIGTLVIGLVTTTLFFSRVEMVWYGISLLSTIIIVIAMYKGLRQTKEPFLFMISLLNIIMIIAMSLLNLIGVDITLDVLPYFMVIFVLTQAMLLAVRFAKAFFEVEQLSKRLMTLDGLKDEFMANTSHELRTPLHGMINIAESLKEGAAGAVNAKMRKHLTMIVTTGQRLSLLVNDILDFSKLKNGDLLLVRKRVNLPAVTKSVLEVVSYMAGGKSIRFEQDWPTDLPFLDTDEERLQQILFNLLGNAVKFTDQGEVRIGASVNGETVTVSVSDTGIGIAEDRLEHIFISFEQAGAAPLRQYSGTGLGLSITKKLVELSGGRIWVESQLGQGSVFRFTLPASLAEPEVQSVAQTNPMEAYERDSGGYNEAAVSFDPDSGLPEPKKRQDRTVLIVDDDPINLQVLINRLEVEGYNVIAQTHAKGAWEEIQRKPNFDLIIVDWMMPGMTGIELTRLIRGTYSLTELPVLMLTARSRTEDIMVGFEAGVNDFLTKPVDPGVLRARVQTMLELRKSVQTTVRTEMAFLQAQIKPHFLYNALNTVISLCPVNPSRATELLIELSQYLRGSFDFQNRDQLVPISKELELVQSYLILEKARFEERLSVIYEVDVFSDRPIPPLSIQPIVENAVRHGIMQRAAGGTIRIRVQESAEKLEVVVSDDGIGMEPSTVNALLTRFSAGKGIGLLNIHKRLMTLYGAGLHIDSVWNRGTTVRFEVPDLVDSKGAPYRLEEQNG